MSVPNLNEMDWMVSVFGNKEETFCVHAKLADVYIRQEEAAGRSDSAPSVMDEQTAQEWTRNMKNANNTNGPHWPIDKIKRLIEQRPELQQYELPEVFAVINMMYSDYCKVAEKLNVNSMDFYVGMTKAWLDDEDAGSGKDKTLNYYKYVVQ